MVRRETSVQPADDVGVFGLAATALGIPPEMLRCVCLVAALLVCWREGARVLHYSRVTAMASLLTAWAMLRRLRRRVRSIR